MIDKFYSNAFNQGFVCGVALMTFIFVVAKLTGWLKC